MSNLATPLRQALRAALPAAWRVGGFITPGRVDRPTVAVWTVDLAHTERVTEGAYLVTYTVAIYTPHQDPEKADNALDGQLQKVIAALWDMDAVLFDRAERTVTNDQTVHAWVLTVRGAIALTPED